MYAVTRFDTMTVPLVVNTVGFLLNASFVICYWIYAELEPRSEIRKQFFINLLILVTAGISWIVYGNNDLVGYFASFVNILSTFFFDLKILNLSR